MSDIQSRIEHLTLENVEKLLASFSALSARTDLDRALVDALLDRWRELKTQTVLDDMAEHYHKEGAE